MATGEAVPILSETFLAAGPGTFDHLLTQKNFFGQFSEINLGEGAAWVAELRTHILILEHLLSIR